MLWIYTIIDVVVCEITKIIFIDNKMAYDVYSLLAAKNLKVPLLTLDQKMIEYARKMKITIIEV